MLLFKAFIILHNIDRLSIKIDPFGECKCVCSHSLITVTSMLKVGDKSNHLLDLS